MPDEQNTPGAAPQASTPQDATSGPQAPEKTFTASAVEGIVRSRVERLNASHQKALAAAAEAAARATADRLRESFDAELAELAEVAGVTPRDILHARRMKRQPAGVFRKRIPQPR